MLSKSSARNRADRPCKIKIFGCPICLVVKTGVTETPRSSKFRTPLSSNQRLETRLQFGSSYQNSFGGLLSCQLTGGGDTLKSIPKIMQLGTIASRHLKMFNKKFDPIGNTHPEGGLVCMIPARLLGYYKAGLTLRAMG